MDFHGDAIILSGETGTKLKCEILQGYYRTWWGITSGGKARKYNLSAAIVELNAGSGLDYIEDTGETILGSSGHALSLKMKTPETSKLKVLLVEEESLCYSHLKNVLKNMWPQIDMGQAEGPANENKTGVYLLRKDLAHSIETIDSIPLGNSLFFFDPLLYTPWPELEKVARKRIHSYYHTQTEFIVFLFTSDWFRGRRTLNLAPLPRTIDENKWRAEEKNTVEKMDELFGNRIWRASILKPETDEKRMESLVAMYRIKLHRWFRYVLPLPFRPKENQLYHLFVCSNYERGIGITKGFYLKYAGNPSYAPDDKLAYSNFRRAHPETMVGISRNRRPVPWKFLWAIIKNHDEGLCDIRCQDFREIEKDWRNRLAVLEWLELKGFLKKTQNLTDAWSNVPPLYELNWDLVKQRLGVDPPSPLVPLEPRPTAQPE